VKNLTPAKVTLLMFVAVAGLVVAYVAKTVLARAKPPEIPNRLVPMPIADLQPGTVITPDHLGRGPIPQDRMERDMLMTNSGIVGRVVKDKLSAAQPIRGNQLYAPGETVPLKVQRGMRAISVSVGGMTSLVDGLIKPGDHVDVHFYPTELRGDPRVGHGLSVLFLEGAKILAINRAVLQNRPDRERNVVTLELTPEQATAMTVAAQTGMLSLSYNPTGKGIGGLASKVTNRERVTIEEILNLPPIPKPEEPIPVTSYFVEEWRGAAMRTREFGAHNMAGLRDSSVQPRRRNTPPAANSTTTPNSQTSPSPSGQDPVPPLDPNDPSAVGPDPIQPLDQPANRAPAVGTDPSDTTATPPATITNPPAAAAVPVAPQPDAIAAPVVVPNSVPNPNGRLTPVAPPALLQPPAGGQSLVQPPGQPTVPGGVVPAY
jgi:Flp pilus assembly protein CpaB